VPIAGAGAPVARSALAWALGALAPLVPAREPFARAGGIDRYSPRFSDPLSLWSLALLLECLLHPDAALSLSVQLSYAATLGLFLATGPTARALRELLPGGGKVAEFAGSGRTRPISRASRCSAPSTPSSTPSPPRSLR
jgi:hypothetical protein